MGLRKINNTGGASGSHSTLTNLDYASSGHTGFASSAELAAKADLNGNAEVDFSGYKIYATEKGVDVHKFMEPTMISIRKEITKGITNEEIDLWIGVMEKIQNNLKEKVKIQI